MAIDYQDIFVEVSEETIQLDIVEETIQVDVVEEVILADIVEEVFALDVVIESIDVNMVVEEIIVEVESWCNPCSGGGSVGGAIFIVDVTGSGIVSDKLYEPNTVPSNRVLTDASTDNDNCEIHFVCEGGVYYSPTVTLDGVTCTNLTEDPNDKRFFYGSFPVVVTEDTTYLIESSAGTEDACIIHRAAAGPEILSCVIGAYPGVQTAAKSGDVIHVTGTVEPEATEVRLIGWEAFNSTGWISCSGGVFDITGIVSNQSGLKGARVQARNSFGTEGNEFDSINDIFLDQEIPQFTFNSITYPIGQTAFKGVEAGFIDVLVTDFTSLTYSSPHGDFNIANQNTYVQNKPITCTNPGDYNDSTINYRIIALKASNDTSNTFNRTIEVADTAPHVVVSQPYARLRSSASGINYTITATSNQNLSSAPIINIPVSGTWQGSGFVGGPKVWTRSIRITDADINGTGAWTWTTAPTNRAGLSATISGNEVVGGFVSRSVTLPAFGTTVNIAVAVADVSKLSLVWSFKSNMVFQTIGTPSPIANGWTIDAIDINPTNIIILDTQAAAASTQPSTLTLQESV